VKIAASTTTRESSFFGSALFLCLGQQHTHTLTYILSLSSPLSSLCKIMMIAPNAPLAHRRMGLPFSPSLSRRRTSGFLSDAGRETTTSPAGN